jgi:hypothetical protein
MFFTKGKITFSIRFFLIVVGAGFFPPLFWLVQGLLSGEFSDKDNWIELLESLIFSVVYTTIISTAVANTWNVIDRNFPWESKPAKRIIVEVFLTLLVACSTMILLTWFNLQFINPCNLDEHLELYRKNILVTIVMNIIIVFTFEAIFFFERWRASEIENERLAKESINTQFASLKNQVNPHFLFNSLNSLSALIHEDADKAEEFVDELAKVYRYVLEVKDQDLVLLQNEIDFIESFLHIQQIRFGKNLSYTIDISENSRDKMVPPLSLQLLVENAIKHNKISSRFPLQILLKEQNGWLVIANTLQPREEEIDSTGVGLNNLRQRYKKFTDRDLVFEAEGEEYVAKIPLLNQETWMF